MQKQSFRRFATTFAALATAPLAAQSFQSADTVSTPQEPGSPVQFQWGDFDADGLQDAAAISPAGALTLLRNAGDGTFQDVTTSMGIDVQGAQFSVWEDFDQDGLVDLFVGTKSGPSHLLHNAGAFFVDVAEATGLTAQGFDQAAHWTDYDGDGLLDLHLVQSGANTLYHALAAGGFEPVSLPLVATAPTVTTFGTQVAADSAGVGGLAPTAGEVDSNGGSAGFAVAGAGSRTPVGGPQGSGPGTQNMGTIVPGFPQCTRKVTDDATGSCMAASSTGTLGMLYPLSTNFFVDDANGRVGIGTTSPSHTLTVAGKIVSGTNPTSVGIDSTVGGGRDNSAISNEATVAGGLNNTASGNKSTVGGGSGNNATGDQATVAGGAANDATADYATVPGGFINKANGQYSFAAGFASTANHDGSFVWGDSQNVSKLSSQADEFNVYAEGGVRMFAAGNTNPSMVVDPNGNVGIGTTAPVPSIFTLNCENTDGSAFRFFDLGSSAGVQLALGLVGEPGSGPEMRFQGAGAGWIDIGESPTGDFKIEHSDARALTVATSGNVGIGTAAPVRPLTVQNNGSGDTLAMLSSQGGSDYHLNFTSNALRFTESGVAAGRLTIEDGGNVGVGTSDPGDPLTVATALGSRGVTQRAGSVVVGSYANASGGWYGTSSNHDLILFTNNSFGDAVITAGGNMGIGTLSPSFKLEVNGSAGKPGGGSWSVSSDRRLKKNVEDLEGALDTLLELRGVTFEYKDPAAVNELAGERIGFIAQEVEEVVPDWVEEVGGYKRLTIRGFEALAVEALRELSDENAELRAANEGLEARVARLESMEAQLASLQETLASLAESR